MLGTCLAWAIDNNLTRKLSLSDATWVAAVKGLVAGTVNLILAFSLGAALPAWPGLAGAMVVGFFAYGVSLALFVVGLRHLGTARTGAYFSVAPFFGALLAIAMLGEPVTAGLVAAGALLALGVGLHLSERPFGSLVRCAKTLRPSMFTAPGMWSFANWPASRTSRTSST